VRWVDVALRLGVNEYTVPKWKKCLEFQSTLEARHGFSVLELLGLA
jgi:hypothetical protein